MDVLFGATSAAARSVAARGGPACVACDHSLRGSGPTALRCPECGFENDAVAVEAMRRAGPWWEAPGFRSVMTPAAWTTIGPLVVVIALPGIDHLLRTGPGPILVAGAGAVATGWAASLFAARRRVPGPDGLRLAMACQGIVLGVLVGLAAVASALLMAIERPVLAGPMALAGIVLVAVMLRVVAAWERWIADRCRRLAAVRGSVGGR